MKMLINANAVNAKNCFRRRRHVTKSMVVVYCTVLRKSILDFRATRNGCRSGMEWISRGLSGILAKSDNLHEKVLG